MQEVVVKKGTYRNESYKNVTGFLVSAPKRGAKGWFVRIQDVEHENLPEDTSFKMNITDPAMVISVDGSPIQLEEEAANADVESVSTETDEEITTRIKKRFNILTRMAEGSVSGAVRSLIVSGAAGVGKSYTVEKVLEEADNAGLVRHTIVKGTVTPINLYKLLYEYSEEDCVIVMDDADSILFDEAALNLLKGALDTTGKRVISYMSESLEKSDVPQSFDFKGTMIFISNINFQKIVDEGKSKLAPHFEALLSRSLYLDLTLRSKRDLVCWMSHVIHEGEMLIQHGLTMKQSEDVLTYLKSNVDRLREVSLRTAIKTASLIKMGGDWKSDADIMLLKGN